MNTTHIIGGIALVSAVGVSVWLFAQPAQTEVVNDLAANELTVVTESSWETSAEPASVNAPTNIAPEETVSALLAAMDANDGERIQAAFAPNATQAYGTGQPRSGPAFTAWLQSDIIAVAGRVDNPQITAEGNEVIVTGQYQNDNGYESAADFLFTVEDGLITSWTMRY